MITLRCPHETLSRPASLPGAARAGRAALGVAAGLALGSGLLLADPLVTRLTPPSALFDFGDAGAPYIARFLPGQRFDLEATIQPDAGQTITGGEFLVDGRKVRLPVGRRAATTLDNPGTPANEDTRTIVTVRAYALETPGVHTLEIRAAQSDGKTVTARGNFEVVRISRGDDDDGGKRARNIIVCIGDGMGIAHRTAARIMLQGVQLGKANGPLAMDTFPHTALITTHSLNSIVTDSSPGAACYSTGNKANNNQQGVFPDDTRDNWDNPRVELIGEYLFRTEGRTLGIVTTSDVFDATPGAFGTHTQSRGAGTGVCDQYLDEMVPQGLRVLMGGGRKWFLPNASNTTSPQNANGSQRTAGNDYVLPADLAHAWGVPPGTLDPARDLLGDFELAGFTYAANAAELAGIPSNTDRLLGLFAYSNMNVAKDKIDKRRGASSLVDDYGFPDQPMLDEMTDKALQVLSRNRKGFVLMVEAASIDKQAHNMDTERWLLDTVEFDRAIAVCKRFAETHPDTLVIATADHECAGVNIIGASRLPLAEHQTRAANTDPAKPGGVAGLRNALVGTYESAGFPVYQTASDGYPASTDVDRKMLIGYAANADRYEDWLTNPKPLRDSQQPFNGVPPLSTYPSGPLNRDVAGNFLVTGQIADPVAAHTASDIPLSAFGRGASLFHGVLDNTDVFFKLMQAALGGTSTGGDDDE
jgi:alkaline phosphatase